jgi:hypothetical protein
MKKGTWFSQLNTIGRGDIAAKIAVYTAHGITDNQIKKKRLTVNLKTNGIREGNPSGKI